MLASVSDAILVRSMILPNSHRPKFMLTPTDAEPVLDISTEVLRAELLKRVGEDYDKPECGSNGARGSYNTSLHVAALILILVLSTAGGYLAVSRPC